MKFQILFYLKNKMSVKEADIGRFFVEFNMRNAGRETACLTKVFYFEINSDPVRVNSRIKNIEYIF